MWDACCAQAAHDLCPFSLNAYHIVTGINLTNFAVLDGFTITGGVADDNHRPLIADESQLHGGGIFLSSPDFNQMQDGPVIARCRLVANDAEDGAGLYNEVGPTGGSKPTFANLEFRGNSATHDGGGAWSGPGNQPLWVNCLFAGNTADSDGAGLFMMDGTSDGLTNCTFVSNSAVGGAAGGVYLDGTGVSPPTTIANCIFWLNTDAGGSGADAQIAVAGFAVTLAQSDVQGIMTALPSGVIDGGGNIDADPQFVNPAAGNYRLLAFSPCVEVGDNLALPLDLADLNQDLVVMETTPRDLDINDRVMDSPDFGALATVDMGAYEFVASACPWDCDPVPGDGVVGITDFLALLGAWTAVGVPCDQTGGPGVGIQDFLAMFGSWGPCPCAPPAPTVPSLQEEIENAGLVWPDDWDAFVDVMVNGTQGQQDNYLCWMKHYLGGNCHGLACIPPTCPGPDPFSSPPLTHLP